MNVCGDHDVSVFLCVCVSVQLEEGDRLPPAEEKGRQQQRHDRGAQERSEDRGGQAHPGRPHRCHGQRYSVLYVCMYSMYVPVYRLSFPSPY